MRQLCRRLGSSLPNKNQLSKFQHKLALSSNLMWGTSILLSIVLLSWATPLITTHSPTSQNLIDRLQPPLTKPRLPAGKSSSQRYLLGTDKLGRDIYSRLLLGTRNSLLVALMAVLIASCIGTTLGLLKGYLSTHLTNAKAQSWTLKILGNLINVWQSIPYIMVVLAVVGIFGKSMRNIILVLGITTWIPFYRVISIATRELLAKPYIFAARALGASYWRITWRYVIPNLIPIWAAVATSLLANIIVFETALSFLGLGLPANVISLGSMVAAGYGYEQIAWWLPLFPGLTIFIVVLGVNLFGDGLRDWLEPN